MNKDTHGADGIIHCKVAHKELEMTIDSGSVFNTISENVWRADHDEFLSGGAKLIPMGTANTIKAFAYAQSSPLNIIAHFSAPLTTTKIARPLVTADFIVVQGAVRSLMSKGTAMELNVLRMGGDIASITLGAAKNVEKFPIAPYHPIELDIDERVRPSKQYYYRIPLAFEAKVAQKIKEMLETGIIEECEGEPAWLSGLSIVIKDENKFRLVLNMRRVNQAIRRPYVIIPTVEDIRNKLGGAGHFSKFDLTSAFFHLLLSERSRNMTCFMTRSGMYRYCRLAFGLVSAPEIFQRFMDKVLEGIDGALAYLDDILVYAKTAQDLKAITKKVKQRLKEFNLSVNAEKSEEGKEEIVFLGHRLDKHGINIDEEKRRCILAFREPTTKSELRSFLGLAGFVSQYIIGYSDLTEPLWQVLRGVGAFKFSKQAQEAFAALKEKVADCTVTLGAFNQERPIVLYTDASQVSLSAVLTQWEPDEDPVIVTCTARTLSDTERRYDQATKEALAMVWACEHLQFYLLGREFTLKTDSSGAVSSLTNDDLCTTKCILRRINGYKSRMEMFNVTYEVIPGKLNIADAASRLSPPTPQKPMDEQPPFEIAELQNEPNILLLEDILSADEIREASNTDETTQSIVQALGGHEPWPENIANYERYKDELVWSDGILARAGRIVVPENAKTREKAIAVAHDGHPGMNGTKRRLRTTVWWPGMDREVEAAVKACKICFHIVKAHNMTLMHRTRMPSTAWDMLAIDHFGPFADLGKSHVVALIDFQSTSAFLERIFEVRGYCNSLRSDNGSAYRQQFEKYCTQRGIKPEHSTPYSAFQKGCVEAIMRIIGKALKVAQSERGPFGRALRKAVIAHNSIPHSVSGLIPAEAHFGGVVRRNLPRLPSLPAELDISAAQERDWYMKLKDKDRRDKIMRAKESDIKLGDFVVCINRARAKADPTYLEEQHRVISAKNGSLVILSRSGTQRAIHVKDVKLVPLPLQEEYQRQSREAPGPSPPSENDKSKSSFTAPLKQTGKVDNSEQDVTMTQDTDDPQKMIPEEEEELEEIPEPQHNSQLDDDMTGNEGGGPSEQVPQLRRSSRVSKSTRKNDFTYLMAICLMQDHADVLDLVDESDMDFE